MTNTISKESAKVLFTFEIAVRNEERFYATNEDYKEYRKAKQELEAHILELEQENRRLTHELMELENK